MSTRYVGFENALNITPTAEITAGDLQALSESLMVKIISLGEVEAAARGYAKAYSDLGDVIVSLGLGSAVPVQ